MCLSWNSVQKPCWSMISSGIILPNIFGYYKNPRTGNPVLNRQGTLLDVPGGLTHESPRARSFLKGALLLTGLGLGLTGMSTDIL
jgi:hypothetical protein